MLISEKDIIEFICILILTPFFIVLFSELKTNNIYIHKLLVLGIPISLSFIIRRMIVNSI